MPRYIFPAATGVVTGGLETTPIPGGRFTVNAAGAISSFAGPDDIPAVGDIWIDV